MENFVLHIEYPSSQRKKAHFEKSRDFGSFNLIWLSVTYINVNVLYHLRENFTEVRYTQQWVEICTIWF